MFLENHFLLRINAQILKCNFLSEDNVIFFFHTFFDRKKEKRKNAIKNLLCEKRPFVLFRLHATHIICDGGNLFIEIWDNHIHCVTSTSKMAPKI